MNVHAGAKFFDSTALATLGAFDYPLFRTIHMGEYFPDAAVGKNMPNRPKRAPITRSSKAVVTAHATQRRVGSVRDAIAILRYLENLRGAEGVNRIARSLDLGPSSCFNLLKTLVGEQFVDFDESTKLYSLGPGAIALGRRALDPAGAFELIRQRLERLADRHKVTAGLWRPRGREQVVLVGFVESSAGSRIHLAVGQRLPSASGSGGRCLMAFSGLDETTIRRRFNTVKWSNAPDFEAYLANVRETQATGWAMDEGNFVSGVTSIAAPCLSEQKAAEYVVTATLFNGQHTRERLRLSQRISACRPIGWLSASLRRRNSQISHSNIGNGRVLRS